MTEGRRAQGFVKKARIRMGSKIGSDKQVLPMEDQIGAWMPVVDTSGYSAGGALKRERTGRVTALEGDEGFSGPNVLQEVPWASDLEVAPDVMVTDSVDVMRKVFGSISRNGN